MVKTKYVNKKASPLHSQSMTGKMMKEFPEYCQYHLERSGRMEEEGKHVRLEVEECVGSVGLEAEITQ